MLSNKLILQQKVLRKLLGQSKHTLFGEQFSFSEILKNPDLVTAFQKNVPIQDYAAQKIWWSTCLAGASHVVSPGTINYFALSSGTSDNASKFIPVSDEQLAQLKRQGIKFWYHIAKNSEIPISTFLKRNLLIGGSSNLQFNGCNYTGDLSGILQHNLPFWYRNFSAPTQASMKLNWAGKIEHIVSEAKNWNVSIITGIPSWVQLVLEKIIERYQLKNIHELWPNLNVYIHSGIRAEPYRQSMNRLFGKKVFWYETYLASEGFFAYQVSENAKGMRLILNDNIFFEFVPFHENNVDATGALKPNPQTLTIDQVQEQTDYVLLLTNSSGAWRYVIGDTIRFTDNEKAEITLTGRTSHFLSVVGEHLSLDNMNQAIQHVSNIFQFDCKEFTVYAENKNGVWRHCWNIGCDVILDAEKVKSTLDEKLKDLNDDYRTERIFALKNIEVSLLPNDMFYSFLEKRGKTGGQVKFPRVLKGAVLDDWCRYIFKASV
jgi:hypothetical protein